MNMIGAVVFDLDRTLVDVQSFTDYAAALAQARQLVSDWPVAATPPTGWTSATRACMDVLVALAGDPRWLTVSEAIERHERAAVGRSVAMPGLRQVLHATAHLPRAVATLLPREAALAVLEQHRIAIDVLMPRRPDMAPKPAPDACLAAAAALGFAGRLDRVLMVGDSTWDHACAEAAGASFVGLRNGGLCEFAPGVDSVDGLAELARRF